MNRPGKRSLSPATIKAIAADYSPVDAKRERRLEELALAWMRKHQPALVAFWEGEK